jgi:hypothetical protein
MHSGTRGGPQAADLNAGRQAEARAKGRDGVTRNPIDPGSMNVLISRLQYSPIMFQAAHLDAETGMRGFRMASAAEKAALVKALAGKVANSKTATPVQQKAWAAELRANMCN